MLEGQKILLKNNINLPQFSTYSSSFQEYYTKRQQYSTILFKPSFDSIEENARTPKKTILRVIPPWQM